MLKIRDIDQTQAPLLDHLIELRTRLVRCVVALALAFAVCFYFAEEIFAVLVRPLAGAFPEGPIPSWSTPNSTKRSSSRSRSRCSPRSS